MLDPLFAKLDQKANRFKIGITASAQQLFSVALDILSHTDHHTHPVVLVFPDMRNLRHFTDTVDPSAATEVLEFPPIDILPFEPVQASFSTMKTRMNTLLELSKPERKSYPTLLATPLSLLQRTLTPANLQTYHKRLATGQRLVFSDMAQWLQESGYDRVFQVQQPGEFAIRGFIMDIFPLNQTHPIRVETCDDEIEEIRLFSIDTQKTTGHTDEASVFPAREYSLNDQNRLLFSQRMHTLHEKYPSSVFLETLEHHPLDYPALGPLFHEDFHALIHHLHPSALFIFLSFEDGLHQIAEFEKGLFELYPQREYRDIYFRYLRIAESALLSVNRCVFLSHTTGSLELDQQLTAPDARPITVHKRPSQFLQFPSQPIPSYDDLIVGSLVVHEDFGIARYLGSQKITNFLGTREYLKLEYEDAASIFVPLEKMHRIHQYVGDERLVKLTRLKSQQWQKAKRQTQEEIERKVQELIELYALRKEIPGISFTAEHDLEQKFLDSFPYIETPPQLQAVEQVLADMEAPHPMDHLVCGDAGAGKTEVAMRAAFRAISNGRQVAMLVPTTVLAKQHFDTIYARFHPFGIQVRLLDRMITAAEEKKIQQGLKEGVVEMVIGTHKLFNKKIKFHDLGLLIIDEEQKFGVDNKEKIQQIRKGVDVLTLTATPIPRTLYMGLSGIKAMSVIDTLPPGRVPIQTFVGQYDERIVKTAILRELSRGGQIIYVHNRVEDMQEVFQQLQRILPEARMEMAHGQMKKSEFERAVSLFYGGETDILVCTTIIESGVDIPRANTLIVDDANRYGLSQLYQLRGRVGRSDRRAFAYFLHPKKTRLTPQAKARLEAIFEHHGMGSGMKLAMKDMEIRGVGNLLGFEQHGNAQMVGLHLYQQMLDQVLMKKGLVGSGETPDHPVEEEKASQIEMIGIPFDIVIPESYVDSSIERMRIYRRIARTDRMKELDDLRLELKDRFGNLPNEVQSLFEYASMRMMGQQLGIQRLEVDASSSRTKIQFLSTKETDRFSIRPFRGMIHREEAQVVLFNATKAVIFQALFNNYQRLKS